MAAKVKVLISGATGYIGGSVLVELLKAPDASNYEFSALIRSETQAAALKKLGVQPVIFGGLDDLEGGKKAAAEHDIVISCASASHDASAKAWIEGLGERQKQTGKPAHFIHTSGTSILADQSISGKRVDTNVYSDKGDVYGYEKNHPDTYSQRVADLAVVAAGEAAGVKTYIIVPPTIYGRGSGPFNTLSQQVSNLIRTSLKKGHAVVIGEGKGIWNHVHIADLSKLYSLFFHAVVTGKPEIPYGKKGIYFAETGEHTWLSVSEGIRDALKSHGLVQTSEIEHLSLKEAADLINNGDEDHAEIVNASNSRSRADLARELLGWKPEHGNESFFEHFDDEVAVVSKEFR